MSALFLDKDGKVVDVAAERKAKEDRARYAAQMKVSADEARMIAMKQEAEAKARQYMKDASIAGLGGSLLGYSNADAARAAMGLNQVAYPDPFSQYSDATEYKYAQSNKKYPSRQQELKQMEEYLKLIEMIKEGQVEGYPTNNGGLDDSDLNKTWQKEFTKPYSEAKRLEAEKFSRDPVAKQVFTDTGKAPQCIYISATEGHNAELHVGGDHFWITISDDNGNAMRVRMPRSEFERMMRAEEESKAKP